MKKRGQNTGKYGNRFNTGKCRNPFDIRRRKNDEAIQVELRDSFVLGAMNTFPRATIGSRIP
ncbi:hypothetical protein HanPI659440_Chr13g0484961 [Helianthus annuus]|nr:hypothetical protein HanPI659440_Chr13g0484961 [Helianthus annuus]